MRLMYVDRGSPVSIVLEDGAEVKGSFVEEIDEWSFHAKNQDTENDFGRFLGKTVNVRLFYKGNNATAKCIVLRRSENVKRQDSYVFVVLSEFKTEPRRSIVRIEMAFKTRLQEITADGGKGTALYEGMSGDVNMNGIRVFTDVKVDAPQGSTFMVSFSLIPGYFFNIPAKMLRSGPNMANRSYAYDSGFLFDFTNMPDKQDKLVMDILEAKLRQANS